MAPHSASHVTAEFSLDLVVTENVFYEKTLARTYDLKGSVRSRFVAVDKDGDGAATADLSSAVLLDENLRQSCVMRPLTVSPDHLHRLLQVRSPPINAMLGCLVC